MRRLRNLLRPTVPDRLNPAAASSTNEDPTESKSRTKILVVDDDAIILKTATMKLESKGFAVVTAKDGSEAIRVARQENPALILLDLSFPPDVSSVPWDGFRIMSWLQRGEETKDIPVVVITGGNAAQYHRQALESGARAFFNKPIDHAGLLTVIQRILGLGEPGPETTPKKTDFEI